MTDVNLYSEITRHGKDKCCTNNIFDLHICLKWGQCQQECCFCIHSVGSCPKSDLYANVDLQWRRRLDNAAGNAGSISNWRHRKATQMFCG